MYVLEPPRLTVPRPCGIDAVPGTRKAEFNVKGNEMMGDLAKDLDIPFKRNGSLVLCFAEEDRDGLQMLYDRGIANGVKDLKILEKNQVLELEPHVSDQVVAALLHRPAESSVHLS